LSIATQRIERCPRIASARVIQWCDAEFVEKAADTQRAQRNQARVSALCRSAHERSPWGYSIPPFGSDVQHLRLFRSLRAALRNMIGCATREPRVGFQHAGHATKPIIRDRRRPPHRRPPCPTNSDCCARWLVTGARRGRSVIYSLYDNHVALLLDEAVYHIEHLGLGISDETPATG
jgi:hypothetical protein